MITTYSRLRGKCMCLLLVKSRFFLNTRFNSVLLELEFRYERELRCMNCLYC